MQKRSLQIKIPVLCFFILIFPPLFTHYPQQHQEVTVRNVIVPLRIFDGDTPVKDLSIDDLEVYEEGKLQKIQALYHIKGNRIERTEGRDFLPYAGRSFYFLFHLTEYHPKITEGFDFFFTNIYRPDDYVAVMTPLKYYELSREAVQSNPKEKVVDYIRDVIRRDSQNTSQQYNAILRDQIRMVKAIANEYSGTWAGHAITGGLEILLERYREGQQKLRQLFTLEEQYVIDFATQLKRQDGQKNVFLFYQKEYKPEPKPHDVSAIVNANQDQMNIVGLLKDCFQSSGTGADLDVGRLKNAFADSSILFNVIFVDKKPDNVSGLYLRDLSDTVSEVFSEVVGMTGGIFDSSYNPAHAFEAASRLTESYYLLYYSPEMYVADGRFKSIEVRVKGKEYKIFHRLGYIAD